MPSHPEKQTLLLALGGNALIKKGERGTIEQQFDNLRLPIRQIARLSRQYRIIITHGNGPQVGNLMLQQEACRQVPQLPLEILVAQTQGQIGYLIESTLDEELMTLGVENQPIVSLISYVVVDKNDPAFNHPTKPIGPGFTEAQARKLGYSTVKTAKGFRRVVASPQPVTIVEKREIRRLLEMDFIVICCGGGGIPVIREGRGFNGVDAVIDKDLASVCLAREVGVGTVIIATDVEGAMLNYGKRNQQLIRKKKYSDMDQLVKAGHFAEGSMLPKVEASVRFIQGGGKRALITSTDAIETAVAGKAGTEVI